MAVAYQLCSVTEVKSYLGITTSKYDTVIDLMVSESTDWTEQECGNRRFFNNQQNNTEIYDGDYDQTGRDKIFLKRWPITVLDTAQNIEINDGNEANPNWIKVSASRIVKDDENGIIYFLDGLPYGEMKGRRNIRITYQGGYIQIPNDLKLACIKMVAKEFGKRLAQGLTQESVGGGTFTWNEQLDPSVTRIISKYRRF